MGTEEFGTKIEIKNLNSIRSLYRALLFEEARQRKALEAGEPLVQETRHWDEDRGETSTLRSKEFAFDYRYFPEPDLLPIEPDAAWIEKLRADLPELPAARRRRFGEAYGMEPRQSAQVSGSLDWAEFFEAAVALGADPKAAANWLTGDVAGLLNEARTELSSSKLEPSHLADLIRLLREGSISSAGAKAALDEAFRTGEPIEEIVDAGGLRQVSDEGALGSVIDQVIEENPGPVEQFLKGKEGAINALVGQVMRKTKGSANPAVAAEMLRSRLLA
jgi:aspartyl-tRNA(Asn)/glutamyl-tRNA(Gln) amidotransferase subunit B